MNFIKSPQQLLLEQAGDIPASPGLMQTPRQMLLGSTGMSPQDMLAELIVNGQAPQKFAAGSTVKNIGTQAAIGAPFALDELKLAMHDLAKRKYAEAAARAGGEAYSMFAPFNPLTMLISGLTYAPEVGDSTLDAWLRAQQQSEPQPEPEPIRPKQQHNLIPLSETRFYKK